MKSELLIGVTGRLSSGKSTLSQLLKKYQTKNTLIHNSLSFPVKQFLEIIDQSMQEQGLKSQILDYSEEQTNQLEIILSNAFVRVKKSIDNPTVLAKWNNLTIIEPLYCYNEVSQFCQRNSFHLISVESPILKRFENFKKKYENLKHFTLELFCYIDDYIYNQSNFLGDCFSRAKVMIENKGDVKDLTINLLMNFNFIFRPVRPDFPIYLMHIAQIVKSRSNCMKRSVGALLVKDNRILAAGYNGTPLGMKNCYENGCQRCNDNTQQGADLEKCFCFHAEENALLELGTFKSQGITLYTTLFPCYQCAKVIIQAGIQKLFYEEEYDGNANKSELHKYMKIEQVSTSNYVF